MTDDRRQKTEDRRTKTKDQRATVPTHSHSTKFAFAADLGGTHLRTALVDREGDIHFRQVQSTPHTETPNEIVRALVNAVRECEGLAGIDGEISAVSIAVPGTVNVASGVVVKAPNLPCLDSYSAVPRQVSADFQPAFRGGYRRRSGEDR